MYGPHIVFMVLSFVGTQFLWRNMTYILTYIFDNLMKKNYNVISGTVPSFNGRATQTNFTNVPR